MDNKIVILGGDKRMEYVYRYLKNDGFDVDAFINKATINDIQNAQTLILGMPCSRDGINISAPYNEGNAIMLNEVLDNFKGKRILGGKLPKAFTATAAKYDIICTDYACIESLMVYNAISTAEGAIQEAMANTPFTLCNSECLVIGYGRIGKILCKMLSALGSNVTATARKQSDFALCAANGLSCVNSNAIGEALHNKNIIFNTVPYKLLNGDCYKNIDKDSLIIDLASMPGYIDKEICKEYGIKVIHALALPGKTAPQSAGYAIYKAVCEFC